MTTINDVEAAEAAGWDFYSRADGTVYAQKQLGDNRIEQAGEDTDSLLSRINSWEAYQVAHNTKHATKETK